MRVAKEFSRFAKSYNKHNIIQVEVVKKLISYIPKRDYQHIVDIGCGRGEVYNSLIQEDISFSSFTALDISKDMLELHHKDKRVRLIEGDFGKLDTFDTIYPCDIVISSSALQWSSDLDITLDGLSNITKEGYFAIFTSNTFATLHKYANIISPIYTKEYLQEKISTYFVNTTFETLTYRLSFESVYKMLRYIKESGTSGGESQLSYKQIKRLIEEYPLDYLEFEVLFVRTYKKV